MTDQASREAFEELRAAMHLALAKKDRGSLKHTHTEIIECLLPVIEEKWQAAQSTPATTPERTSQPPRHSEVKSPSRSDVPAGGGLTIHPDLVEKAGLDAIVCALARNISKLDDLENLSECEEDADVLFLLQHQNMLRDYREAAKEIRYSYNTALSTMTQLLTDEEGLAALLRKISREVADETDLPIDPSLRQARAILARLRAYSKPGEVNNGN